MSRSQFSCDVTFANLLEHPDLPVIDDSIKHVCIGDLHGNALKLIYTLIHEGFLELNDKDNYKTLQEIYYKMDTRYLYLSPTTKDERKLSGISEADVLIFKEDDQLLTREDLETFATIISDARCNQGRALTLIGDVLCDRGQNDYFTLLVLKKLKDANVDVDIMFSNHDCQFIRDYERLRFKGRSSLSDDQGQSLMFMYFAIKQGWVSEGVIRSIVETSYLPLVKAIGYTVSRDKKSISLFTHAPVGLETIELLAEMFSITYSEDSIDNLIATIDAINAKIKCMLLPASSSSGDTMTKDAKQFSLPGLVSMEEDRVLSTDKIEQDNYLNGIIDERYPLSRLIGSRTKDGIRITAKDGAELNFDISFTHGHNGDFKATDKHESLDNDLGKSLSECKSKTVKGKLKKGLLVRHSKQLTSAQLMMPEVEDEDGLLVSINKADISTSPTLVDISKMDTPPKNPELEPIKNIVDKHIQALESQIMRLEQRVAWGLEKAHITKIKNLLGQLCDDLKNNPKKSKSDYIAYAMNQIKMVIPEIHDARGSLSIHRVLQRLYDFLANSLFKSSNYSKNRLFKTSTEKLFDSINTALETTNKLSHH